MPDFATWMVVLMRVTAMLGVFPVFSSPAFPARLRIVLALGLASFIAPTVAPVEFQGLPLSRVVGLLLQEGLVGLLLGFVARMAFYAVEIAGALISTEMGLSLSPSYNPLNAGRSDTPTLILYYLGAMLFLTLDLHHWLLAALQRTYEVLPIAGARLAPELLADLLSRTSRVFGAALQMAAPLIAVAFLVTLLFSLLGRAVPQMNVFTESFGVRLLAGLAVFGLTLNLMAQHVLNFLRRLPEDLLHVSQLLALR